MYPCILCYWFSCTASRPPPESSISAPQSQLPRLAPHTHTHTHTCTHTHRASVCLHDIERKLDGRWVVWLWRSIWFELYCQSYRRSYAHRPLNASWWQMLTKLFPLLNVSRVCVCLCVCFQVCLCVYPFICASLLITKSREQRQTPELFCHLGSHPFFHLASAPARQAVHPSIINLSPSHLAGPRPFCPVVWAVLWWRTGAVSFPWPCPDLSVGRPGREGGGGPGIRVRAEWLGTVVSTFSAHAHAALRRCRGLISRTQQLMLGRVLAVTGNQSLESGKERGRETNQRRSCNHT